jgi:hypothetical protein
MNPNLLKNSTALNKFSCDNFEASNMCNLFLLNDSIIFIGGGGIFH